MAFGQLAIPSVLLSLVLTHRLAFFISAVLIQDGKNNPFSHVEIADDSAASVLEFSLGDEEAKPLDVVEGHKRAFHPCDVPSNSIAFHPNIKSEADIVAAIEAGDPVYAGDELPTKISDCLPEGIEFPSSQPGNPIEAWRRMSSENERKRNQLSDQE